MTRAGQDQDREEPEMGNSSNRDADEHAEREITKRCLELRLAGATYEDIGDVVGRHKANVYRRIKKAIQEIPKSEVDELRALESERLSRVQRSVWRQALEGHLGAVDRVIKISERRSRLLGLDSPQRVDLEASSVDIDAVARDILGAMTAEEKPEEALDEVLDEE